MLKFFFYFFELDDAFLQTIDLFLLFVDLLAILLDDSVDVHREVFFQIL